MSPRSLLLLPACLGPILLGVGCEPLLQDPPAGPAWELPELRLESRLVGESRVDRTVFDFRYAVTAHNEGAALASLEASAGSDDPASAVLSPPLRFGAVPRGGSAEADGLLVIRQDRRFPFLPGRVAWQSTREVARDDAGYETDPPGAWFEGDLHVHATGASNDTGRSGQPGNSFPENIAAVARERGLDFVVLTDHSNSTGSDPSTTFEDPALFNMGPEFPYWDTAAALSEPGVFLMVDGNELSPRHPTDFVRTGHVGCIPPDLESFPLGGAFVDRPMGTVDLADTLAQARARGCFTVLNHPYGAVWTSADWSSFDYDAMEVWNGGLGFGWTVFDVAAHAAWRCDLLAGRPVTPLATSDNHRVFIPEPGSLGDPALGWPRTAVFARELAWPAIVEGLRAGRVALHGGESRLYLDGYDADRLRAEGPDLRRLRLRGRLDPDALPARLRLTRAVGCDDPRPGTGDPVVLEDVLLNREVAPGTGFDLEVAVAGEPGVYTATLIPAPVLGAIYRTALSRALVVE